MHQPLPKLQQIPAEIAAVTDYEAFARARMSESAWAYMAGGAADELTLRDNCAAFQRLGLPLATLADLRGGDAEENAAALRALLDGAPGAYRDIVLLNAAAALLVAHPAPQPADDAWAA